jgi:hypothetical protein
MPIRPENLHRYPPDWPEIRARIMSRAGNRCEHPGCDARHHQLGYWYRDRWTPLPRSLRDAGVNKPCVIHTLEGPLKIIRIVLTIAHLDHQPENCAGDNLRAWCQRHHLGYDFQHHAVTRARTRHANANTVEMF